MVSSSSSPTPIGQVEITGLRFNGEMHSCTHISELLEPIRKQARRKNVQCVSATLTFGQGLSLPVEVQDRGARVRVPNVGLYAFSVDGILHAVGDYIRKIHNADPSLLDIYQDLLESVARNG